MTMAVDSPLLVVLDTAENAEVVSRILEAPGREPMVTVRQLAHRLCRREIVREIGPLRPSPCHSRERIQGVSDLVSALPGLFWAEEQGGQ